MPTNKCTRNDIIGKPPFGNNRSNNSAKKHYWVLNKGVQVC